MSWLRGGTTTTVMRLTLFIESSWRKMMTDKISGDGAACVDHDYFWRPIETAPHGVKLQLLSIYGVASHGLLSPAIIEDGFWMGWTPLPKKRKENE